MGAFLSGGIDSSAVVAAMAQQSSAPVKTFSIGFDVEGFDETPYAREVAQLYGTDHHELIVRPDAMEILPTLVSSFGEPFADNSAIPTFCVARMAREHVTVALNGDGGDESFGGYERYLKGRLADRLAAQPRLVRRATRSLSLALGPRSSAGFRSKLDEATRLGLMTPAERYEWRMAYFKPEERPSLYTEAFGRQVEAVSTESPIVAAFDAASAADEVNRLLDVDVQTYLPNALLVKMDITSMTHSLEVRSPLLDHRLMEFAARLPGAWKVEGTTTKRIFREALRPWLPASILDRPKRGFGSPMSAWFRGPLSALPAEVLLDPSADRGWFRRETVRSLIDDHVHARRDNMTKLWALLQLELWLRTYIEDRREQSLSVTGISRADLSPGPHPGST